MHSVEEESTTTTEPEAVILPLVEYTIINDCLLITEHVPKDDTFWHAVIPLIDSDTTVICYRKDGNGKYHISIEVTTKSDNKRIDYNLNTSYTDDTLHLLVAEVKLLITRIATRQAGQWVL